MTQINIVTSLADKQKDTLKKDAVLTALRTKSAAEIDQYIENQVTDLASAKEVLKILTKVIAYLTRSI